MIVVTEREAHVLALNAVGDFDGVALPAHDLIGDGTVEPERSMVRAQIQVAPGIDPRRGTRELELDRLRARAGCDDEIVFQVLLIAVVHEIDAAIHAAVAHPAEHGHAGLPL
jgi:hypothetical protein